ncbi:hypothetical protein NHX12_002722, partial [Muraenolepis orangiensis]
MFWPGCVLEVQRPNHGGLNVLAKALFDNVAESPDELSFRKGDIMTVVERDTQGLDGWWLCSLHGRQGIVPGNRLKILVGMYDAKQGQYQATPPGGSSSALSPPSSHTQAAYGKPPASSSPGYPLPSSQYTSMHSAYSMPTPAKPYHGNMMYMMPPSHGAMPGPHSLYQVPPGPAGAAPQPPSKARDLAQKQYHMHGQDIYQVPPSLGPVPGQGLSQGAAPTGMTGGGQDIYQVPPSLEKKSWGSSSVAGKVYVYDTVKSEQDEYDVLPRHQDIYDVPPTRQQYNTQ